jgi:hypothetical protein
LYTKAPHFEAHSTILTEFALVVQSVARKWAGALILGMDDVFDESTSDAIYKPNRGRPIIIVTGSEADIIESLLRTDICRKILHLPMLNGTSRSTTSTTGDSYSLDDDADFLNQVEIVKRKHLSLHGVTSFFMDMANQASFHDYVTEYSEKDEKEFVKPYDLLGLRVAKYFTIENTETLFRGTINSYEKDDENNNDNKKPTDQKESLNEDSKSQLKSEVDKYLYCVVYDDGDKEEYEIDKLYGKFWYL